MMLLMTAVELAETGALVIGWFQGLSAGNRELPSRVGTVRSSSASTAGAAGSLRARAVVLREPFRGCANMMRVPLRVQGEGGAARSGARRRRCRLRGRGRGRSRAVRSD